MFSLLNTWLRSLSTQPARKPIRNKPKSGFRLRVEELESRLTPSGNGNTFSFAVGAYEFSEGAGSVAIEVVRSSTSGAASVDVSASDGLATSGDDYDFSSQTVNFADGVPSVIIFATVNPDSDVEGDEDFAMTLANPSSGYSLSTTLYQTVVTIDDTNPVTHDANYSTKPNVPLTAISLLENSDDAAEDELTITIVDSPNPDYGQLTQNTDGTWTFTPNTDWTGTATFTYKASDGVTDRNTSTVTITVVNNAPAVFTTALSYTILPNAPLTLNDLISNGGDADSDALVVVVDSEPINGTLSTNSNGVKVYTPNLDYTGTDSFTMHLTDGDEDSETVTVTITVTNEPAIIANPVVLQAYRDEELVFTAESLLTNAMSQSSSNVELYSYENPSNGVLTVDSNGVFHYVPNEGYVGTDFVTFVVTDGQNSATSTLSINVQGTNALTIDFNRLNGVASDGAIRFLIGYGQNLDSDLINVRIDYSAGPNAGTNTVSTFAAALQSEGWNFVRDGNRITITSRTVGGVRRPVTRGLSFVGAVPAANRPEYAHTDTVTFTARDGRP